MEHSQGPPTIDEMIAAIREHGDEETIAELDAVLHLYDDCAVLARLAAVGLTPLTSAPPPPPPAGPDLA
jgi:sugar phosphate isomerase/epimerase